VTQLIGELLAVYWRGGELSSLAANNFVCHDENKRQKAIIDEKRHIKQ